MAKLVIEIMYVKKSWLLVTPSPASASSSNVICIHHALIQCNNAYMYGKSKQLKIKNHKKKFFSFSLLSSGFFFVTFIEVDESSIKHTYTNTHGSKPMKGVSISLTVKNQSSFTFFVFSFVTLLFVVIVSMYFIFGKPWNIRVTDLLVSNYLLFVFCIVRRTILKLFMSWHPSACRICVCVCIVSFHLTQANAFRFVGFCVLFVACICSVFIEWIV